MKESSVSAFARATRWIACAAVALTLGAGTLLAQATGKIEGRVRDQAGAPIASAQVRIDRHRVRRGGQQPGLLLHQQRARRRV